MLGYVHLLPETHPALERRTVAGTALWVLEGDLDGGLLPRRRLRRWTRRLAECGVSHAALPPGREVEFAPIRPVQSWQREPMRRSRCCTLVRLP